MIKQPDAPDVLEREFLELRAGLLQIAAQLDRLDRATGSVANDPRMHGVQSALRVLAGAESGRAEQVQMIFSRNFDPKWKQKFDLVNNQGPLQPET